MEDKPISLADILSQHRKRYKLKTSIGSIVLKHLSRMEQQKITIDLASKHPEYEEMAGRFAELMNIAQYPQGLGAVEMQELSDLNKALSPLTQEYFLPCFVSPELKSLEMLEALATALTQEEWMKIQQLLTQLVSARPISEVDSSIVLICNQFGIKLADDLTAENLTNEQAGMLEGITMQIYEARQEAERKFSEKMNKCSL